jgi:putative ABC transport system permease protein
MPVRARLASLLRNLFLTGRVDRELDEELRAYVHLRFDERRRSGMPEEEARRRAIAELGGMQDVKVRVREARVGAMVHQLRRDVRYALRLLRLRIGFTLVAVTTLALGLGVNAAMFSVFDTVVVRPLAYRDPDRLYVIHEGTGAGDRRSPVNALHYRTWRRAATSFDEMGLLGPASYTLSGAGEPVQLSGARATPSLFSTLGIEPALGRGFLEGEDVPGRDQVVILSHELWVSRFGADPLVIGKTARVNDTPHTVVGVLPQSSRFAKLSHYYALTIDLDQPRLWKPFAATPRDLRPLGSFQYVAFARLKPGVPPGQAVEELNAIQAELARQAPEPATFGASLVPLAEQLTARSGALLRISLGVVSLVLLIACVNVTNLLLARGGQRQREFAIRAAAGATRLQLVLQLMVEGFVLSGAAGLVGVVVSAALVSALRSYAAIDLPRLEEAALDLRGLLFIFAITLGSGLLIGVLPAWRSTRATPVDFLRSSSATAASGSALGRLRTILIGAEVAASLVCLVVAALLVASFVNLMSVERGFDAERLVTAEFSLPGTRYSEPGKAFRFVRGLAERARTLPGVAAVGVTDRLPLSGVSASAVMVEGVDLPRQQRPRASIRVVDGGYFRALGIELRAGRFLTDEDVGRRVAVVSSMTARRLWPQQDPLGKRFRSGPDDSPFVEVVGVAGDVRDVSLAEDPPLNIYAPLPENFAGRAILVAKTASDPAALSAPLREAVRERDPELAVTMRTMEGIVTESVATRRFQMNVVLWLGIAAAFLAGLGIYGVVSQAVAQRTSEFGIRMALGAEMRNIRDLVLLQGLVPVAGGVAVGVVAAVAVGRVLRTLLFGVSPTSVLPFVAAALFLVAVAVVASLIPAWRAARLDPIRALRCE